MKKKVYLCEDIHQQAYELLNEYFDIIDDFNRLGEVDAILVRNFTIDKNFIEKCKNLKVVAVHGTGYNNVDVSELKKKNVTVFRVPGQNALSVAEFTVGLILDLSRKISLANHQLKKGKELPTAPAFLKGLEISNKTIGLVGFGYISKQVLSILKNGFCMNAVVYSPSLTNKEAKEYGITKCESLEKLFKKADVVSIHCPLNEKTDHMIDLSVLKYAKKDCIFINTARGAIVSEDDLYYALKNNIIKAAACDVFENEPVDQNHPLLSLDNFVATPHIAASTDEALLRVGIKSVEGLIAYFEGKNIDHVL